jgi:formamidopyrimidine-DNA glycosylase
MPELPEVEAVRTRLEGFLSGKEIRDVDVRCARLRIPVPTGLTQLLNGSHVSAVKRTGKYLLIHLNRGTWLVHLGMSGRFLFGVPTSAEEAKHDHLVLRTSCGSTIRYNDFRRFGTFAVCPPGEFISCPSLRRLGIDAMSHELDGDVLFELLRKRKAPIKVALLDQGLISGLGNIYACESLYWSGIHPLRSACSLIRSETHQLALAVRQVLLCAIEAGGSTLRDYEGTSGALGSFDRHFAVFQREGTACPRCHSPCVSKVSLRGRATYYCSTQQQ